MIITVGNSYSYISKHFNVLAQQLQNKIIKKLCYYKKSARGYGYNEVALFFKNVNNQTNERYYQFPTGLLTTLIKFLRQNDVQFSFIDDRGEKPPQLPIAEFYKNLKKIDPDKEERDYQVEAITLALQCGRGVVSHSTAAGKTLAISGIAFCVNCRTLILCKGIEHVDQISNDIAMYTGRRVTCIRRGQYDDRGPIIVSNVQQLQAIKEKDYNKFRRLLAGFKCVIGDEIHHAGSTTWKEIFYFAINAYHRYGFSGTVFREDNAEMEIVAAVGPVFHNIDQNYLTTEGYISPAHFLFIDPMCYTIDGEDDVWPVAYYKGILENEKRNRWLASICDVYQRRGSQVLVITSIRESHGRSLQKMISNSVFVSGKSAKYHREQALKNFKEKQFGVLIGTSVYDEVINLPDVRCVIMAGGGKAHNAVYQRIGRGLRTAEGKSHVDIIVPWDSHSSVLLRHSIRVLELIKKVDVWREHVKFIGNYRKEV